MMVMMIVAVVVAAMIVTMRVIFVMGGLRRIRAALGIERRFDCGQARA